MVARGDGEGGKIGMEFPFSKIKNAPGMDGGDGCIMVSEYLITTELYTEHKIYHINLFMCILPQFKIIFFNFLSSIL